VGSQAFENTAATSTALDNAPADAEDIEIPQLQVATAAVALAGVFLPIVHDHLHSRLQRAQQIPPRMS